uniref:Uncharacterized protein n=1 Tax=Heterorhabditis bacteriophora TaxID=37862 RepID=A0A1I7X7P9_HETBA
MRLVTEDTLYHNLVNVVSFKPINLAEFYITAIHNYVIVLININLTVNYITAMKSMGAEIKCDSEVIKPACII